MKKKFTFILTCKFIVESSIRTQDVR